MQCEQLRALPEEEQENIVIQGRPAQLTVIRESFPDGAALVVVRGFLKTWARPTFISFTSFDVGRVVAEGLLVEAGGTVTDAPDEDMWYFR